MFCCCRNVTHSAMRQLHGNDDADDEIFALLKLRYVTQSRCCKRVKRCFSSSSVHAIIMAEANQSTFFVSSIHCSLVWCASVPGLQCCVLVWVCASYHCTVPLPLQLQCGCQCQLYKLQFISVLFSAMCLSVPVWQCASASVPVCFSVPSGCQCQCGSVPVWKCASASYTNGCCRWSHLPDLHLDLPANRKKEGLKWWGLSP